MKTVQLTVDEIVLIIRRLENFRLYLLKQPQGKDAAEKISALITKLLN